MTEFLVAPGSFGASAQVWHAVLLPRKVTVIDTQAMHVEIFVMTGVPGSEHIAALPRCFYHVPGHTL